MLFFLHDKQSDPLLRRNINYLLQNYIALWMGVGFGREWIHALV